MLCSFELARVLQVIDQEWYQNYVHADNLVPAMLFDVLSAANYMEIKPLLDLACLKVTFTLKGKNAEEVSPGGIDLGCLFQLSNGSFIIHYF